MESSLCFKPQPQSIVKPPFSFHPLLRCANLSTFNLVSKTPLHKSKKRILIVVSARKNPRRNTLRVSTRAALECAFLIATSLKILPEPVNLLIKEGFGDGNGGGGLGFWNGHKGGGGFDGWNGKKLGVLGLLGLAAAGVLFVVLMLGKDFEGYGELGLGVMGVLLLGVLERDWKRGVKGWTVGFCSCALMVVLGLKREELQKWVQRSRVRVRVRATVMDLFRKKRRRRFL